MILLIKYKIFSLTLSLPIIIDYIMFAYILLIL